MLWRSLQPRGYSTLMRGESLRVMVPHVRRMARFRPGIDQRSASTIRTVVFTRNGHELLCDGEPIGSLD